VRILFLSQLLPLPLDAGPKIRSYYVLRHLAAAGHEVTALCFARPTDRDSDVHALGRYCRRVETVTMHRSRLRDARDLVGSLLSRTPFLIRRDRRRDMSARVAALAGRHAFDAVHADQLWMAPYADACDQISMKVLDQHNAVFKVPERLAAGQTNTFARTMLRHEARKLAGFEQDTIDRFGTVVWVCEADRDSFARPAYDSLVRREPVIPIAVDPSAQPPIHRPRPFRVTFVGGLHWPPNAEGVRWFVRECWPTIRHAVPSAVLTIIGQGSVRGLGQGTDPTGVEIAGYVPDLRRHMAETAAFVVPLKTGAGMRVKILDAWCWGLPVVSTTIGAEGLKTVHGEHALIADQAPEFSDAVIRVLTDARLSRRLCDNGRGLVEASYDWRSAYRAWDQVYRS
jgi:glycosyltransferase involved in cell wall biosynthesis